MFGEFCRRLTANYTEEEYKAWLYDEEGEKVTPTYTLTERLLKNGFHKMKDYDIALHEIAEETGYSYEFLNEVFNELDDISYTARIVHISDVALEGDF